MSDDNLRDSSEAEDDSELLELLDRLGPEAAGRRDHLETLGALPWALEELPARVEIRERVMASVARSDSRRLVTVERRSRWFLPIAAGLAAALLGIAAVQFRQLEGQRRTIEQLSMQLARVEQNGAEMTEIRRLLEKKERHLRMLTSRGTEFCLLKPVGERPRFPTAIATMVIAPDRREWFLAAEGLEPCAAGVCYQLWFITDGESISAASFDARAGGSRVELSGSQHDALESVRGISITRSDAEAAAPVPETVLYADQAMTLL